MENQYSKIPIKQAAKASNLDGIIPYELIDALNEDRLVIFAGAGLSHNQNPSLGNFPELTEKIYQNLYGGSIAGSEEYKQSKFENIFEEIEASKGRGAILKELTSYLNISAPNTDLHELLIKLYTKAKKLPKIVTTNFDLLFEQSLVKLEESTTIYNASALPVCKPKSWGGLVKLHGSIKHSHDNIIITSTDFGRAYITDRWASRFVTELFRHYSVLFIGYGINDPVFKYIISAYSKDKDDGSSLRQAYIITKREDPFYISKKLELIKVNDHSEIINVVDRLLYYSGVSSAEKKDRIQRFIDGFNKPESDEFNILDSQLFLKDISDPEGTKYFWQINPSLDFLSFLDKHNKLIAYKGRAPQRLNQTQKTQEIIVSLVSNRFEYINIITNHAVDDQAIHLCSWLCKHLKEPELVSWVLEKGGVLHPYFRERITWAIEEIIKDDADFIRSYIYRVWQVLINPNLLLSDFSSFEYTFIQRLAKTTDKLNLAIKNKIISFFSPILISKTKTIDYALQAHEYELGQRKDYNNDYVPSEEDKKLSLKHLFAIGFQEKYRMEEVYKSLSSDKEGNLKGHILKEIAQDAYSLLKYCHELSDLLSETEFDYSYIHRPSIAENEHNKGYNSWDIIVDMCRDSLCSLLNSEKDLKKALALSQLYSEDDNDLFKRIALYGIISAGKISSLERFDIVRNIVFGTFDSAKEVQMPNLFDASLSKEVRDFFEFCFTESNYEKEIGEEILSYLQTIANNIKAENNIHYKEYKSAYENKVYKCLYFINKAKALSGDIEKVFLDLESKHPKPAEEDKLSSRMSSFTWAGERESEYDHSIADDEFKSASIDQYKVWVTDYETTTERYHREAQKSNIYDFWVRSTVEDFDFVIGKLKEFAENDYYPRILYRAVFDNFDSQNQKISYESCVKLMHFITPLDFSKFKANDDNERKLNWYKGVISGIAKLIDKIPEYEEFKQIEETDTYLSLASKTFNYIVTSGDFEEKSVTVSSDSGFELLTNAINHPSGYLADGLISCAWKEVKGKRAEHLEDKYSSVFTPITDFSEDNYSAAFAKAIFASKLFYLHHFFPNWAAKHLVPLLDWDNPNSKGYWDAYLHNPTVSSVLVSHLKPYISRGILENHIDSFDHSIVSNFISLMTLAILYDIDSEEENEIFSDGELYKMIEKFDENKLTSFIFSCMQQVGSIIGNKPMAKEKAKPAKELILKKLKMLAGKGIKFNQPKISDKILRFMTDIFDEEDYKIHLELIVSLVSKIDITDSYMVYRDILENKEKWAGAEGNILKLINKISPNVIYVDSDKSLEQLLNIIYEADASLIESDEYKNMNDLLIRSS